MQHLPHFPQYSLEFHQERPPVPPLELPCAVAVSGAAVTTSNELVPTKLTQQLSCQLNILIDILQVKLLVKILQPPHEATWKSWHLASTRPSYTEMYGCATSR